MGKDKPVQKFTYKLESLKILASDLHKAELDFEQAGPIVYDAQSSYALQKNLGALKLLTHFTLRHGDKTSSKLDSNLIHELKLEAVFSFSPPPKVKGRFAEFPKGFVPFLSQWMIHTGRGALLSELRKTIYADRFMPLLLPDVPIPDTLELVEAPLADVTE